MYHRLDDLDNGDDVEQAGPLGHRSDGHERRAVFDAGSPVGGAVFDRPTDHRAARPRWAGPGR